MRRFLLLWICLAFALTAVTVVTSALVFRQVDLRYQAFLQLLFIPTFQATVLVWAVGDFSPARILGAIREMRRHPAILAVLGLDGTLLALGWLLRGRPLLGMAGDASLHVPWIGVKAGAASLVVLAAAIWRPGSAGERSWLCLFAGGLLVLGVSAFRPWLSSLENLVPARIPTVLNWTLVYGGVFVLTVAALLHTGTVLGRRSALAASCIDAAVAAGFLLALVVAANIFLRPYLVEPWGSLVRTCLSLSATFVLAASLLGLSAGHDPSPGSGQPSP